MNYAEEGNVKLWTTAQGEGVPILLCSGGPGCCDYLEPVAELLSGRRIRFDARGCGRSAAAAAYSVATSLADLEIVRRHYGVEKWLVIGHSWGADLALLYALAYPQHCLGLACLSGGLVHNDREWSRAYRAGRDAGLEQPPAFAYPPNPEVNKQVSASWKAYIQRPGLLRGLAELKLPALFVYGSEDIRPGWAAQQVAALLGADFRLLRGADHYLWRTHAQELSEELNAFTATLSDAQPPLD